jgi:hypothetical protein
MCGVGETRCYVAQYIVPVMTTNVQSDIVLLRVDIALRFIACRAEAGLSWGEVEVACLNCSPAPGLASLLRS